MSTDTLTDVTALTITTCVSCGVRYALPRELDDRRQLTKDWTYCPNGHQQQYIGRTMEEQRDEARAALLRSEGAVDRLSNDILNKVKHIKRLKTRAARGVCLFCKRHFVNVERHVQSKHKGERKAK